MRHLRTSTLTTLTLLTLGGGLVWSAHEGAAAPGRETGIEAASGGSAASSTTSVQPTHSSNTANTTIPAATKATTERQPKHTTKPTDTTPSTANTTIPAATKATTERQPKHTTKPTDTTPSTAKRPGKQEPATGTTTATPTGDPNRIIDNGYINLDGVRVSAVNTGFKGREIYEKCGWIGEGTIKLWFKYANGLVLDERWVIFGRQTHVFIKDMFGEPAWRGVVVEASGLDPYGDSWTEENGYARTEWIWCANLKPIKE
ncbi:MAG: hypothetical protein FJ405_02250 [Verrucomicrobia bacterium]|nr:hypothetical protein [Verrucomicrobiota bacterium]